MSLSDLSKMTFDEQLEYLEKCTKEELIQYAVMALELPNLLKEI